MMNNSREGVIILLENAKGQIAFQLRDDKPGVESRNCWGLFGGWMKRGEHPEQAAVRETKEELCYPLDLSKLVYLTTRIDGDVKSHVFRYSVADELQGAKLTEGQAVQFMALADLQYRNVVPRHREIVKWYETQRYAIDASAK